MDDIDSLDSLASLTGAWAGDYTLILEPGAPRPPTFTSADVDVIAGGKLVAVFYDWEVSELTDEAEFTTEDGVLLIGVTPAWARASGQGEEPSAGVEVAWCDSWHMDTRIMQLQGEFNAGGGFSARGGYDLPDGARWGWRIELLLDGHDAFTLQMYNVSPEGDEFLGVRAVYRRDTEDDE